MSYFTETFESILEFKQDIKASYSARRASEKLSGDHQIGKAAHAAYKAYNSGNDANDNDPGRNSRGYVRRVNAANNVRRTADAISNDKNAAKAARGAARYTIDHTDRNTSKIMKNANTKSNRGITAKNAGRMMEGYDPVYEDLCRMGIID